MIAVMRIGICIFLCNVLVPEYIYAAQHLCEEKQLADGWMNLIFKLDLVCIWKLGSSKVTSKNSCVCVNFRWWMKKPLSVMRWWATLRSRNKPRYQLSSLYLQLKHLVWMKYDIKTDVKHIWISWFDLLSVFAERV